MSRDILLTNIDANPHQPRKRFDQQKIDELAQSISASGLAIPILVRPENGRFIIVHGERRYRAVKLLGLKKIAAEVREMSSEQAAMLALVENVQRSDLTPIEEAHAYRAMLDQDMTQTELGKSIGKSQSYIVGKLRFLKLDPAIQDSLDAAEISEGHAKQLLRLPNPVDVYQKVTAEKWSANRTKVEVDILLFCDKSSQLKFRDLVDFRKRAQLYGSAEHKMRAQRLMGQILTHCRPWSERDGMHWLMRRAMEDAPLSKVWEVIEFEESLRRDGIGIPDCLQLARVPDDVLQQWFDEYVNRDELINHSEIYARAAKYNGR